MHSFDSFDSLRLAHSTCCFASVRCTVYGVRCALVWCAGCGDVIAGTRRQAPPSAAYVFWAPSPPRPVRASASRVALTK